MKNKLILIFLGILLLVFTSCTKEDETSDQSNTFELTFQAEHHGQRFKGHYRFLIKDSKDYYKYDKDGYVQNNSFSVTTQAIKGDKIFIYANLPMPDDTCIVTCKSTDGRINMRVFTTNSAMDSLILQ